MLHYLLEFVILLPMNASCVVQCRHRCLLSRSERVQMANVVPSADQVALSLLSRFNEYHLPKADQLIWLVSEKEAPQAVSVTLLTSLVSCTS